MKSEIPFLNKNIVEETEKFSNTILNKEDDVFLLLNSSFEGDKKEIFAELAFTGKYITGLTNVLSKGQNIPEVENLDNVKKDLSDNFESFIGKLKEIVSQENEKIKKHFEDEYFILNPQSFNNLKMLVADFEKIKIYLNHLKHEKNK
jgi:hypothetical protein